VKTTTTVYGHLLRREIDRLAFESMGAMLEEWRLPLAG
jgi:hypothetical protein